MKVAIIVLSVLLFVSVIFNILIAAASVFYYNEVENKKGLIKIYHYICEEQRKTLNMFAEKKEE